MADATTTGVVTFDYAAWSARYPALSQNVDAGLAQSYFDEATLYLSNTACSPVRDTTKRALLLGLLVSHLATLYLPQAQGGQSGLVGRVSSATRGSVSIGSDMGSQQERAAWFNQTQYGASFWAATRYLRQARYVPGASQRPLIWP